MDIGMANPNRLFPLIMTNKLDETREYYLDKLGCQAVYDMDNYLQVRFGSDDDGPELAFMNPCAMPGGETSFPIFDGRGVIISIPTEDADRRHAELQEKKVALGGEPENKPWGWRSFHAPDPNGVLLDFFHVLEQAAVADATG